MINFDNSATTFPKPPSVKGAVLAAMTIFGGNPGRSGHKLSIDTANAVYTARKTAADFFGAEAENVIFTLNCTHALNLAVKGIMINGGNIIISSLEHNSVARPVYALSKKNVSYSVAEVYPDDERTIQSFEKLITTETRAIACLIGSNVTGQVLPYKKIGELCKKHNICFIADGAQACGILPIKMSDGINILCTAGHKGLYGITGTGLLVTDGKYDISPIMEGGTGSTSLELEQPDFLPDKLEIGTVNTVGIISLGAGIEFINKTGIQNLYKHELSLCELFINEMSKLSKVIIYRKKNAKYLPIVLFNINGYSANETAGFLSDHGFALRSGLHCSGMAHKAIGTLPDGAVRFSPSVFNSEEEVRKLIMLINILVKKTN